MATWLYPISKRSGREFCLNDGTRLKVSADSYAKLVKNGRLGEDELWGVSTNFRTAKVKDEVFIYTGDKNIGIIGYAKISEIELGKNPTFHLRFDLKKCAALLDSPVPASEVRKWLWPRSAVGNLNSHLSKLQTNLPWRIKTGQKEQRATRSSGPKFGRDPEQNKKVEKSAISAVTKYFQKRGWKVVSVEAKKIGYDLLCSKGFRKKQIEVKGTSQDGVSFIITARERRTAQNKNFVLSVVSNALSKLPEIDFWTGQQMEKDFSFAEISYLASLKN